ncbi:Virulence-associated protein E [Streptococcus parauberis]|uniref:VapE domain-containing protein n=1 Tax=Streptococcus parauberis TaxID=1348 RepID=UPI000CCE6F1A|nr:VapE domain-containing protein [Streptococcus parauberis]PNY20538.1 Virulence-associated protein E [Streptococcus parauberis]
MTDIIEKLELITPDVIENQKKKKSNVTEISKWPGLIVTDKDKVLKSRANLTRILTSYDANFSDLFCFNQNTHEIEILDDRKLMQKTKIEKGYFDDTVSNQIAGYISNTYYVDYKSNEVADEVEVIALQNSVNPIKSFLTKARINAPEIDPFPIIQKYLNIEDTEYNRIVLDLFFRGAIARVLSPSVRFDYCLDLVGKQGAGKTNFLRQIFLGFYEEIESFSGKDDLIKMVGAWVVNDDELVATKKSTFEEVKRAITRTKLSYRPPYGRATKRTNVDFVYTRTTNHTQHLGDATGDRRFLPVKVNYADDKQLKKISEDDLTAIWGNYYRSYYENDKLYYDDYEEEGKLIAIEREKYKYVDDITERINWYLETYIPSDFYSKSVKGHDRRNYYYDLEEKGTAYRDANDQIKWVGDTPRDRVNIRDMVSEIFPTDYDQKKIKAKAKLFLDNLDGWEYKKSVRFGEKFTSGWIVELENFKKIPTP